MPAGAAPRFVIQHVCIVWTKATRGVAGGRLRAALARAHAIDLGSAPVSLQAICLREAQDFAVEQRLDSVCRGVTPGRTARRRLAQSKTAASRLSPQTGPSRGQTMPYPATRFCASAKAARHRRMLKPQPSLKEKP